MLHIPIILTQHAEDAAVLWQRRTRAVNAPHYNKMYLGRLDEQLEAHIDGLRIAGSTGWDEALAAYDDIGGAGEMFTLATLAFGHDTTARMPLLIDKIQTDPNRYLGAAASGIGWLHSTKLSGKVSPLLTSENPIARALAVGGCACHRVDPGKHLTKLITDAPGVRRCALKLAGEMGRVDLLPAILEQTQDSDPLTAFWATWAAVLLGDRGEALQTLLKLGLSDHPHGDRALRTALIAMGPEAGKRWLDTQPVTAETTVKKITGYGILGDAGAVPWLIAQMSDPALAQIAGESYALITGADLAEEDLDQDPPETSDQGPNDDPTDDNVDLDDNENLPFASADHVAAHWHKIQTRFAGGAYMLGRPAGVQAWQFCFAQGYQRQRRVAATWLAISDPTAALLNWKTPAIAHWR